MNENTTKLLEQLANKLGTTTEYLWRVLLNQAPVDATITLIQFISIWLFGFILYKIHRKLMKKDESKYGETGYEKYEEAASVPMVVGVIIFTIMALISFCFINNIVNGYFSPEYWALKEILDSIK